jgi:hypothetical protein
MKKNKKSTKQRRAHAKRGVKKFTKEKASRDEKHLRIEKRKQIMLAKKKKLDELISRLSGEGGNIVDKEMRDYMASAPVPPLEG